MIELHNPTSTLKEMMSIAWETAIDSRAEFFTPEHLLYAISLLESFREAFGSDVVTTNLLQYLNNYVPSVPSSAKDYSGPEPSIQFITMMEYSYTYMVSANAEKIDVPHIVNSIMNMKGNYGGECIGLCEYGPTEFFSRFISSYEGLNKMISNDEYMIEDDDIYEDMRDFEFPFEDTKAGVSTNKEWLTYVTCLNDLVDGHNPLIGRGHEIERTVQILCRKDKNNPVYVGEPGVGKTALAYGLAAMIEDGNVPTRLKDSKIYELDLGGLIAGTQYRGDFEKRIKSVLKGAAEEKNAIIFIDEIHNIIGAGRTDGGTMDASNMLKPYLERGEIRFIGATTYDEYNKTFASGKAFARRFEKIDVEEPTVEDCKKILFGLKEKYETYHTVEYTPEAIEYAAEASAKYITGKFLPDKAIDLIDEAGAWLELHPKPGTEKQTVDKSLISEVLAKICHVDMLAETSTDTEMLQHLQSKILAKIFGQDSAVKEVCEAVQMANAGLNDDNKPMASLLFVGPTGVGKTEVARILSENLSVPLVRFDMSEYAEKHAVAKLIGAPAGYVGYEEGGLLTDAIRKAPHCVLLLDEIEKAHQDIYNILLQVMDYAMLTDNKGQKADFRHVIIILTTNAGAQEARFGSMGFTKTRKAGDTMMKNVKQTFKPEFINRLTSITIFNDMDRSMAERILDKKLDVLRAKLASKNVELRLSDEAQETLLKEGFSEEYGGREIDRVINSKLKPLLMRAILFGELKSGGTANVRLTEGDLSL